MDSIIQFIIFAVIFFRIVSFFNGMRGGNKKSKPTTDVFGELQKQLKQLEDSFNETVTPTTTSEPVYYPEIKEETYNYPTAKSSEITEAPYSNLEEGIIDSIHASKFEHHDITSDEIGKEVKRKGTNYLKDFDAKKAFVYSVIFDRKHFDV